MIKSPERLHVSRSQAGPEGVKSILGYHSACKDVCPISYINFFTHSNLVSCVHINILNDGESSSNQYHNTL